METITIHLEASLALLRTPLLVALEEVCSLSPSTAVNVIQRRPCLCPCDFGSNFHLDCPHDLPYLRAMGSCPKIGAMNPQAERAKRIHTIRRSSLHSLIADSTTSQAPSNTQLTQNVTGFGNNNNNNAPAGGSLFGAKPATPFGGTTNNTGSLFGGSTTTPTTNTAFGSNNSFGGLSGTTFGSGGNNTASGFGAFGNNNNNSTGGLFGPSAAKPLFGAGGTGTTSGFGASNNAFGGNTAGVVGPAPGTDKVPFNPFVEKEANGTTCRYETITFQDPYKPYSLEELRLADYNSGHQFGNASGQTGAFGQTNFGNSTFTGNAGGFGSNTGGSLFGGNNATTSSTGFGSTTATTGGFGSNNTGGGLFGSANQNKPGGLFGQASTAAPAGGLFGTSNNNANTTSTFGGFGSNANTTSGGLFGNANANQTQNKPGGLFGSTANTTGNTGGGFSFGNSTNNQTNTTGGLFGNNNAATTTNTTGGLFGSNTNNQQQAGSTGGLFGSQNQTSGGLFGAKPAATGFGTSTTQTQGGGLFGNNTSNTGGGLFGQNQATQNNTGGGLFGNNNTANTGGGLFGNQTQNKPGGLFGNTATTNTGGGLFGGNNTNNNSGGLFNNNANNNNNQQSTGLFGTTSTNTGGGLFGGAQNNQNKGGLFGGNTSTNNQGSSMFGNSMNTGGLFGQSQNNQQNPQQQEVKHASLLDPNPYGQSSIWTSLPQPTAENSQPLFTPLTATKKMQESAMKPLPSLRLNQSRYNTPPRRNGFGFSYSTYGTPSSATSTPGGASLSGSMYGNRSLSGGSFGRSFNRSASVQNLRSYYASDSDDVWKPNAFAPSHRNSSGSIKRLTIDRSIRQDLFNRPQLPALPAPKSSSNGDNSPANTVIADGNAEPPRKLNKRVSFENTVQETTLNGTNGALVRTEQDSDEETTPPRGTNGTAENARGNELQAVPEDRESHQVSSKPAKATPKADQAPGAYWMKPSRQEIAKMPREQRRDFRNFQVGRNGCGFINFDGKVDLESVNLDDVFGNIVNLEVRSATVYPDPSTKPMVGKGLNVPSTIELENSWPRNKGQLSSETSGRHYEQHIRRLKKMEGTEFINYDSSRGIWKFKVPHYTTYGLDYDDDEGMDQSELSLPPTSLENSADASEMEVDDHTDSNDEDDTFAFKRSLPGQFSKNSMIIEDTELPSDDTQDQPQYDDGSDRSMISEEDMMSDEDQSSHMPGSLPQPPAEFSSPVRAPIKPAALGTPGKPLLDLEGDWAEQLQRTISPRKQNRDLLREAQSKVLLDKNFSPLKPKAAPQVNFRSSMDIMNSIFLPAGGKKGNKAAEPDFEV